MIKNTDEYWLDLAYRHASIESFDPSTQNAAVIVLNGCILSTGVNSLPSGVERIPDRLQRPVKYQWTEHAERNAIYRAASCGIKVRGATMYCPWAPCAECARAIIQSGIRELVGHDASMHATRPDWAESLAIAIQMMEEAGVIFRKVHGQFGVPVRFNGQMVQV